MPSISVDPIPPPTFDPDPLVGAEQHAEILRRIEEAVAESVRQALATRVDDSNETAYERVRKYLKTLGNHPTTTTQILNATGISRSALSNLLYVTHKERFDSVRTDGNQRKRLWNLRSVPQAGRAKSVQPGRDMQNMAAHDCCRRILEEHGNEPMHILTLAKEAISRGYSGRGKYAGDAMEWVTAKSFWARLSRTNKHDFEQVETNVFKLKESARKASQHNLFGPPENEEMEG